MRTLGEGEGCSRPLTYKATNTTNGATTDSSGARAIDFKISRATVGYQVVIDIAAGGSSCRA